MQTNDKDLTSLNLFAIETKTRQMISELVEPISIRAREDRESFSLLSQQLCKYTRRIEEIEFVIHKTQKRDTVFEQIFQMISRLEGNIKAIEAGIEQNTNSCKDHIDQVKSDMKFFTNGLEFIV